MIIKLIESNSFVQGSVMSNFKNNKWQQSMMGSLKQTVYMLAIMVISIAASQLQAEVRRMPIDPADPPAPFTSTEQSYSYVSGPGKPWTHGYMAGIGYRSGREGVMYAGPDDPKPDWLPLGNRASGTAVERGLIPPIEPLLNLHIRDTSITLGGDGNYYMTGSTGDNIWDQAAGVELWRSTDLQDWEYMGLVWSFDEATSEWMKQWGYTKDLPTRAVWAPEIHYLPQADNYFIAISFSSGAGCGLLMSTTKKPEGPYASPFRPDERLSGGIDGTLFEDDDGKVYFTRNRGERVYELKPDFSGFVNERRIEFERPADGSWTQNEPTYEGAHLFKHSGKYYLGGAAFYEPPGGGHRYSSVLAVSDTIYGPYRLWHEAVPCGGGGNYFKDKEGRWWVAVFGNDDEAPFREMPGIIRVEFADNGRVVVSKDQPFVNHPDWNGPYGAAAKVAETRGSGAAFSITQETTKAYRADGSGPSGMKPINLKGIEQALQRVDEVVARGPFSAEWESLSKYVVPEWFTDAKFGIYTHWGVYTVPAYHNEWYPRHMYAALADYHSERFGPQSEFGYKDFIPDFQAQNWDPKRWAELYKRAGARFAGTVSVHHDGFAMWASDINRWNAKDMGPKRDITGELAAALRELDMRIVVTFHHGWNILGDYYKQVPGADTANPEFRDLYGQWENRQEGYRYWLAQVAEVIDKYQPDEVWFDSWMGDIPAEYRQKMLAYYYNRAAEWGKEVVVTYKQSDLPRGTSVLDMEKGRMDECAPYVWQTDDTMTSTWSFTTNRTTVRSVGSIVHDLVDTVSKNGVLLLNAAPRADGTIPDSQEAVFHGIGEWLDVNGDAIYGTRPWKVYGERGEINYRFTTKAGVVYAIALGWPAQRWMIKSLGTESPLSGGRITGITLLGSTAELKWEQTADALTVNVPSEKPCAHAYVFAITFE